MLSFFSSLLLYFNFTDALVMANNLAAAAQTNDSENASHSESQSESQRVDGQPVAYVNHAMEE